MPGFLLSDYILQINLYTVYVQFQRKCHLVKEAFRMSETHPYRNSQFFDFVET